jgi:hypothetical protein
MIEVIEVKDVKQSTNTIEVVPDNTITKTSPTTKAEHVDGDFAISHDLSVGGMAKIEGGALVKGDIKVLGRLLANFVNGDNISLETLETLETQINEFQNKTEDELGNIKSILDELTYVYPAISSFSIANPNREIGDKVSELTFNWVVNKQGLTLSINQGIGEVVGTSVTKTLSTPLTSNQTFTLSASDDKNTVTKNATLSFLKRAFWFVDNQESVDEATILSATNSALVSSRVMTKTFNCSGGKYIYICIPTSLCSGTVGFTAFGLSTSFVLTSMSGFKNKYGVNVPMNVYRSLELQNGSNIEIKVS